MNKEKEKNESISKDKIAWLVGPPEWWQVKRDCQIKFLLERGLKPFHYLLDHGCGVLRGGIPIIDYLEEGHYYGIETDKTRIEKGVIELEDSKLTHKNPTLSQNYNDIRVKFDYIWSFQVFIHLSDEIITHELLNIKNVLKDDGVCYASVVINDSDVNGSWLEYPYVERALSFYELHANRHNLSVNLIDYDTDNWVDMLEIRKK